MGLWILLVVAVVWLLALSAGVAWLSMPARPARPARPVRAVKPVVPGPVPSDNAWRARQLMALEARFRDEAAKPDILRDEQVLNDVLDWHNVLLPPGGDAGLPLRPSVPVVPGRPS